MPEMLSRKCYYQSPREKKMTGYSGRRAAQGVEAVLRAQRAKPKEGTGAEAGKGKDGEDAKARRENEKEEAKAGSSKGRGRGANDEAGEAAPVEEEEVVLTDWAAREFVFTCYVPLPKPEKE